MIALISVVVLSAGIISADPAKINHKPTTHENKTNDEVDELEPLNREALDAHNEFRAKHGVPPLKIDPQICDDATQHWVDHLAEIQKLQHSQNPKYGENLYWFSGAVPNGQDAVENWYSEVDKYDWNKPGWQPGAGHFTQLIWKSTQFVCIAKATASDGSVYVAANYKPPGNDLDHFKENVLPRK